MGSFFQINNIVINNKNKNNHYNIQLIIIYMKILLYKIK